MRKYFRIAKSGKRRTAQEIVQLDGLAARIPSTLPVGCSKNSLELRIPGENRADDLGTTIWGRGKWGREAQGDGGYRRRGTQGFGHGDGGNRQKKTGDTERRGDTEDGGHRQGDTEGDTGGETQGTLHLSRRHRGGGRQGAETQGTLHLSDTGDTASQWTNQGRETGTDTAKRGDTAFHLLLHFICLSHLPFDAETRNVWGSAFVPSPPASGDLTQGQRAHLGKLG